MARHYRLVLMALAVLLGAMSLAIAFGSTSTVFYGPEPGLYHFMGRDVSAIVPTGAAILAATLVAGAIYRRGSVRSWVGHRGDRCVRRLLPVRWRFGFTGWKEPTQAPGSLQAEPGR